MCIRDSQYAAQWELGDDFMNWIREENLFCSTLVDRIVTGYPRSEADSINEENGYIDNPVSYTHLDVYKRQDVHFVLSLRGTVRYLFPDLTDIVHALSLIHI